MRAMVDFSFSPRRESKGELFPPCRIILPHLEGENIFFFPPARRRGVGGWGRIRPAPSVLVESLYSGPREKTFFFLTEKSAFWPTIWPLLYQPIWPPLLAPLQGVWGAGIRHLFSLRSRASRAKSRRSRFIYALPTIVIPVRIPANHEDEIIRTAYHHPKQYLPQ